MITFQQILNGDSGLSARAKINSMFLALINGEFGVGSLWKAVSKLLTQYEALSEEEKKDYERLCDFIEDSKNYTDAVVSKVYTYVDAQEGGLGGIIESPSYDPSVYPPDKAVTLTALGAGTFIHFLDVTGTPITISNDDSITIFYRAANASYWSYTTKVIGESALTKKFFNEYDASRDGNSRTLSEAILSVPPEYRWGGLKVSFIDSVTGSWITYQLRKNQWSSNVDDWKDTGNLDNAPDYFYLDESGDIWGHFGGANTLSSGTLTEEGDLVAVFDEVGMNTDGDFISNILSLQ